MLQKILMVLVATTVLASDPSKNVPEVINARKEIRICFTEVLTGVDENRKCKNTEDFKGLAEQYIKLAKNKTNKSVSLNQNYVDILLFALSHPNVKDFLKNRTCINTTSCVNKEMGIDASSIKNSNTSDGNYQQKKYNIVYLLFNPTSEPKYDQWECDKSKSLKECMVEESVRDCSNNTIKFFMDIFDHSLLHCKTNIQPTPTGGASELIHASFLITLILSVTFVLL